jgi:uncharacterized protein YjbJ (UPF0337 family)
VSQFTLAKPIRQEQQEGNIRERYGLAKDQAKKDVEAWFRSVP